MQTILDWSEVWALLIPLGVVLSGKRQSPANRPVIAYVIVALITNTACNIIWKADLLLYNSIPYNGFLYNLHSMVRFLMFDLFFGKLNQSYTSLLSWVVRSGFCLFILLNFGFYEKFYDDKSPFSSVLLSLESALLLILCLQYYFYKFTNEEDNSITQPDFWIVTGLSIYVTLNFFIFLLYDTISKYHIQFAIQLWNFHNLSYILFNLLLAKAFYESQLHRY